MCCVAAAAAAVDAVTPSFLRDLDFLLLIRKSRAETYSRKQKFIPKLWFYHRIIKRNYIKNENNNERIELIER